jgi:hypothetical protein
MANENQDYMWRGMLKRAGFSTRERLNMHGAAITSFIATTAATRYISFGFTDDWKEEAIAWAASLPLSVGYSLFTVPAGYVTGFTGVLYERIHKSLKREKRNRDISDLVKQE